MNRPKYTTLVLLSVLFFATYLQAKAIEGAVQNKDKIIYCQFVIRFSLYDIYIQDNTGARGNLLRSPSVLGPALLIYPVSYTQPQVHLLLSIGRGCTPSGVYTVLHLLGTILLSIWCTSKYLVYLRWCVREMNNCNSSCRYTDYTC